ncbi:MAG: hypothetical protein EPN17_13565 [Methylobacter sp.]|nr:MAG: hypothetical protein EPN17_13565 [Methylobacter sp.]
MTNSSDITTSLLTEAHTVVDLALRYIAAGGSAILAFGLIQGHSFEFLRTGSGQQDVSGWLMLLFIFILGITIYTIHRAVLFRLSHVFLYSIVGLFLVPARSAFALEKETTTRRLERRNRQDGWGKIFDSWAAECHFLYCSSWGILSALALAEAIGLPWGRSSSICFFTGTVLFISALIHDGVMVLKEIEH